MTGLYLAAWHPPVLCQGPFLILGDSPLTPGAATLSGLPDLNPVSCTPTGRQTPPECTGRCWGATPVHLLCPATNAEGPPRGEKGLN